jgi:hypothetical protein
MEANTSVTVICSGLDRRFVTEFTTDLRRRKVSVIDVDLRDWLVSEQSDDSDARKILFIGTTFEADPRLRASVIERCALERTCNLLIAAVADLEPVSAFRPFVQLDACRQPFDLAFEGVFRFALGPLPAGVSVYCRPTQMRSVTGVASWDGDILVADEYYGHVVKVRPRDTAILLYGLDEPYHLHLDRRILSVAHAGSHEIVVGRLAGGSLAKVVALRKAAGKNLRRPHGVFQGADWSAIADTDNHRVLVKRGHLLDRRHEWQTFPKKFKFPCAVFSDGDALWVADTFRHKVVRLDLRSGSATTIGQSGSVPGHFRFPTAIVAWREFVFISDEENHRLQVLRRTKTDVIDVRTPALARRLIGSPQGLDVNRATQLVVGDRQRGCCWIFDLEQYSSWMHLNDDPL